MDGLERRMESLEKRIDVVYSEVSSIKTDIVKMMKELLEKAYGERKD
jgi:chaperonin cofactor prefoldin